MPVSLAHHLAVAGHFLLLRPVAGQVLTANSEENYSAKSCPIHLATASAHGVPSLWLHICAAAIQLQSRQSRDFSGPVAVPGRVLRWRRLRFIWEFADWAPSPSECDAVGFKRRDFDEI